MRWYKVQKYEIFCLQAFTEFGAIQKTKSAVPSPVKLRILELYLSWGQSHLSVVFTSFVICEERDYYCVVSIGELGLIWLPLITPAQPLYARQVSAVS